jgi:hypothetical protein
VQSFANCMYLNIQGNKRFVFLYFISAVLSSSLKSWEGLSIDAQVYIFASWSFPLFPSEPVDVRVLRMSTGSRVHYNYFAQVFSKPTALRGKVCCICIQEGHIFWEFPLQENPKVCNISLAKWKLQVLSLRYCLSD